MKSIISIYMILSILFFSCANVTYLKRESIPSVYLDKINSYGKDHESEIQLVDGEKIKAAKIEIDKDTLHLFTNETLELREINLYQVDWIKINDSKLGLGYGVFIGAGIGTLVGFGVGEGEEMGGIAVLGGIAIGGLLGGVTGFLVGGSHGYKFED